MTKSGKGVIKGSGKPSVEDDGRIVMFDNSGESCCCDNTEDPLHCRPVRWNVVAPEGSSNGSTMTYEMPTCLSLQLSGGVFAGTYEISAIGQGGDGWGGGLFGEVRSITAQDNLKVTLPDNKYTAIYAGWEYQVKFSFFLDQDGTLSGSISVLASNRVVNPTLDYSGFTVLYRGENFFEQDSVAIKRLYAIDSQFYDWDVYIDYTYRPRSLQGGSSNGCSCEWPHRREINAPVRTSEWIKPIYPHPDVLFGETTDAPMQVAGFDDVPGWNLKTGGGEFSAWEYPSSPDVFSRFAPIDARRSTPFEYGDSFSWSATFATPSFVRTTTTADVEAGVIEGGTAYEINSAFLPEDPFLFGIYQRIQIQRRFEVSPTFGGPNTGEMVSYYTIPKWAAQVHTAAAPVTSAVLVPWEKVLPDTTTINIDATFYRPLYGLGSLNDVGSGIESLVGLEYRVTVTVNGITVFSGFHNLPVAGAGAGGRNDWRGGFQSHGVYVASAPWFVNEWKPRIFSQFTEGFDTDCVNSYSGSLTYPKTAYAAPEHCNRVPPEIYLTVGGEKDDFGNHTITFHVGEDIKNYAPPATFVHQAYDRNQAMKNPIHIYRAWGDASNNFVMPPGLSMSATGRMTGTPTTEGSWTLEINFIDAEGFLRCAVPLDIIVKVRNPAFYYPESFVSGGTNTSGADWYMRDGDSGTIESNLSFGTTPYTISYTGDALDGASFDSATGNWTLNPAHTQVGDTSGTVTMSVVDDTNKTDSVTYTWYREGGTPPV